MPTRTPIVSDAHEFLEITRDFTDPKDIIREAISNAMDWGATSITIKASEDARTAEEDLVVEVEDDGIGINEERLEAFFDLGKSTCVLGSSGAAPGLPHIGYKGHGTKTYYNSRMIELWSKTQTLTVHAKMLSPFQSLMDGIVPKYEYEVQPQTNEKTGTKIRVSGYDFSRRKEDFGHAVLKDYILWKTKFGSVEKEFGITDNADKVISLQGLGQTTPEVINYGHLFAAENSNITSLRSTRPGDWTKVFCKRWCLRNRQIVGHPNKHIDIVFYVEGDEAKRSYNPMITGRGRHDYGMYKVEDRYGIWVCKDYIPIKLVNEWLGLGKRLETKYHAFVNCQDLRLTANRGDVGNTPSDLLTGIEKTVKKVYEENIIGSTEFRDFEDSVELEEQYQTSAQEGKDFDRRRKRALQKKVCVYNGIELLEPSLEMGVVSLFTIVKTLNPSLFPFRVVDYDTKRGYDALVSQSTTGDLSRDSMFFIEFKYALKNEFNHAFAHLSSIICWDCALSDGSEVVDIENKHRELRITPANGPETHTKYMLVSTTELHNVEVYVLKDYLREKLGLEFRPRAGTRRA